MDFLDSLDLDTNYMKAHRVRSWYLYEQYKSLEKHQRDALQQLKSSSYQDKLLRQELSERRARRKLYDQFGVCQSESRITKGIKSHDNCTLTLSLSNEEFFEGFSEQEDERVTRETEFGDNRDVLLTPKNSDTRNENAISADKNDCVTDSYSDSVDSVVNKFPSENMGDNYRRDGLVVPQSLVDEINKQLDAVEKDFEDLETIAQCKITDSESECFVNNCPIANETFNDRKEKKANNIFLLWTRLVSFAYQVVQLNHGNCYCDYSSQFLTAVLACDVLRRGVNKMCYNLQPCVSPIKFVSEASIISANHCKTEGSKKYVQSRKSKKTRIKKLWHLCKRSDKYRRQPCRNVSQTHTWQHCCRERFSPELNNQQNASETYSTRRRAKKSYKLMSSSSSSSLIPRFNRRNISKNVYNDNSGRVRLNESSNPNPMLEITRYIDRILKYTEEYSV